MLTLARHIRHQMLYRGSGAGVRGCGFGLKPTDRNAYRDRVMSDYVLVYVLRGSGTFTDWHGRAHAVAAGDAIQMPAGKRHSVVQTPDGQWAEAYLVLDGPLSRRLAELGVIDEARPLLRPGVDATLVEPFDALVSDYATAADSAMPLALARATHLVAHAHALDRRAALPADPYAAAVERACDLLGRDVHRRADVAALLAPAAAGLSYERFRKIFRARTGHSPHDYRIRRRVDRAKALIHQERLSNKQVAYALGYPDPFTFSKQFKQVVGVSPEQFRRMV
jgi:AraC-like DNA-binding protein/quercetin dioxygenase-like cupin family protein